VAIASNTRRRKPASARLRFDRAAPRMALIALVDAELAYGLQPLLDRANLAIDSGERIGLIGRNGTGKSSLLNVIAGRTPLDDGSLQRPEGLRIALVEQEPVLPPAPTLRESLAIRGGFDLIDDERDRWRADARLVEFLHRFGIDGAAPVAGASGGERKRAALALAFALQPQLLLLDEPTNHLDIDGIELLEAQLVAGPTLVVISHDRRFLDAVATRMVELDRGWLRSFPGNFAAYQRRKSEQLAAEAIANRKFDKFWAQEEVWIRKGIEARRTRNEGRVRRLEELRNQRESRRERIGDARLQLETGERSGRLVAELTQVSKQFGGRPVVTSLDLRIMRGDRIGIIGPNGAGKSTLLKLILGTLAPDSGTVRLGSNLNVAYFDQMREQLDPEQSLAQTIAPNSDWVEVGGERRHIISYLGDFLFPPQRVSSPVKMLSGGERNRLLLARLFARPANMLVLDEPTNDLDLESLELLEDTLQTYPGTLLLVSHDRSFLDNVVTQVIAPEGEGLWHEYVGGYSDWLSQRKTRGIEREGQGRSSLTRSAGPADKGTEAAAMVEPAKGKPAKLSYKESRELEQLPATIEALEQEQKALSAAMTDSTYHKRGNDQLRTDAARAAEIERLLEQAFVRWEELDLKRGPAR